LHPIIGSVWRPFNLSALGLFRHLAFPGPGPEPGIAEDPESALDLVIRPPAPDRGGSGQAMQRAAVGSRARELVSGQAMAIGAGAGGSAQRAVV
jgi:hypothetical protein